MKLDFANSVAFFKAFEKAINMYHTSLFFNRLTIPISGVKKYTSLGIRNNEHPVLHSEDKTSPETGIRKRDGNAYPARYNERRNRKNEKGSKHRLCACNFRQVGQESRFIIFIDDMFGKE